MKYYQSDFCINYLQFAAIHDFRAKDRWVNPVKSPIYQFSDTNSIESSPLGRKPFPYKISLIKDYGAVAVQFYHRFTNSPIQISSSAHRWDESTGTKVASVGSFFMCSEQTSAIVLLKTPDNF